MTRMLFVSAFIVGSAMGLASGYAQSSSDSKCGPVAYDQAKQTYVGIPCSSATTTPQQKCGPVAYDQASQTYVGVPCPQGTTDENPAGRSQ
jgi:hypothetical protein